MTSTAGKGPLPAGVTSKAEAFSVPLLKGTISSPARAGIAARSRSSATSARRFMRLFIDPPPYPSALVRGLQLAGRGGGAALGHFASPAEQGRDDDQKLEGHEPAHVGVAAGAEAIRVQAGAEDEVHAVPGHEHAQVANDRAHRSSELTEPADHPSVQDGQVAQKGDEGPGLLGVP